MRKVKILTNSTADLSRDLLEKYDINIVNLYVIVNGKTIIDDGTYTSEQLFKSAAETGELPKTAAANVNDFKLAFQSWLDKGYDIFYTGISTKLSATLDNAMLAVKELEQGRVMVSDSLNASAGIGIQVLHAAKLAMEGKGLKEIYDSVQKIVPRVKTSFFIDTMKYLSMGGRCSQAAAFIGGALNIKPELVVKDGAIVAGNKYRGSYKKVLDKFYNDVFANSNNIEMGTVFIVHCQGEKEHLDYLKKRIEDEFDFKEVLYANVSASVATHCGPKTIGIVYLEK